MRSTGSFAPKTSTLLAVGAGQELFDFGRIAAQAAVADVEHETARYAAEGERLRVELMIKEAFFGVLGARAVRRAAEDAYARARVHRDMAAAGVKSGLHAPGPARHDRPSLAGGRSVHPHRPCRDRSARSRPLAARRYDRRADHRRRRAWRRDRDPARCRVGARR